uniref:Uncharacterized protein n=1 Tax=Anguilla anguilla TaxID=7936 RepID=A0A0E9PL26_ANGAN
MILYESISKNARERERFVANVESIFSFRQAYSDCTMFWVLGVYLSHSVVKSYLPTLTPHFS